MTHYQTLHAHTLSFWVRVLGLSALLHAIGIHLWSYTDNSENHSLEMTSHFNVVLETQQQMTSPALSKETKKYETRGIKNPTKNIIKNKEVKVKRFSKLKSSEEIRQTSRAVTSLAENEPKEDDEINLKQQHAYVSPRVATEIDNRKPYYPQAARRRGMQGVVLLHVKVGIHGEVLDVVITKSSGYPLLDNAAKETIEQWQFRPARRGRKYEMGSIEIPVRFDLRDSG